MTPTTALAWKEWHDARTYLFIGLGLFLGLPLVGTAEQVAFRAGGHAELLVTPWVVALGGVLAVFVGVGVTVGDRRPKLEDFWRSRPIRVGSWLAVKYAIALAVVLACCVVPLAVEMLFNRAADRDPLGPVVLTFFPFFWTAIFSLAFLAGCLVARPSHAATVALAAMLLVYLLPVVLPPLSWMNVADFADSPALNGPSRGPWHDWLALWGPRQLAFAGGMLALAAASAAVAALGVARGWRVESGRRTLYAAVATALLLLFASAAFQLATNLPIVGRADLPPAEWLESIAVNDDGGCYAVARVLGPPSVAADPSLVGHYVYHRLTAGPAGLTVGPPVGLLDENVPLLRGWQLAVGRDGIRYHLENVPVRGPDDPRAQSLVVTQAATLEWGDPLQRRPPRTLKLWDQQWQDGQGTVYRSGDRLFVDGLRRVVLDVSQPDAPRVRSNELAHDARWVNADDRHVTVDLMPLPGLSPAARLAATLNPSTVGPHAFDGQTLCLWQGSSDGIVGYRLATLDADRATFDRVAEYQPTVLQRLAQGTIYGGMKLGGGLLYLGGGEVGSTLNTGLTVVDTRGRRPMRPAGHFGAPGVYLAVPLPDGRAIVGGGSHLYLVGAPPRADD